MTFNIFNYNLLHPDYNFSSISILKHFKLVKFLLTLQHVARKAITIVIPTVVIAADTVTSNRYGTDTHAIKKDIDKV